MREIQVGDVLADQFRIDGELGAGGFATVYRATELRTGRPAALKALTPNEFDVAGQMWAFFQQVAPRPASQ